MGSKYTLVEGRSFKQIDWGAAALPPCQAHLMTPGTPICSKPGEFDSPTLSTSWADLCRTHVEAYAPAGTTIGYHRIPHPEIPKQPERKTHDFRH